MSNCFHCGQENSKFSVIFDNNIFCCNGCKSVYEIFNSKNLKQYYQFVRTPGIKPEKKCYNQFNSLDSPVIFNKIVDFSENGITLVTFKIPVIHCISCVWVLESLKKLNNSIITSYVNFNKKTVQISFKNEKLQLSELATLLTKIGYKPIISYANLNKKYTNKLNNELIIKLAISGFAFGNAMLFSLPEYLSDTIDLWMYHYKYLFRYLMFLLSILVVIFSATNYYKSAIHGIKNKILNIDIPISIGIIVLFLRSIYEIYYNISSGYFDTLCGLVFFMLLGKYFQEKTYHSLSFNCDYKSFYPISVTTINSKNLENNILISDLKIGDRILIHNEEIIPADVILIKGNAHINNSFITGESQLIHKKKGDKIYAGGKQIGTLIECKVIKAINQSYFTQLWNHFDIKQYVSGLENITTKVSKYFTKIILFITLISGISWYFLLKNDNINKVFEVMCAILIVACPCALSVSSPFTMGNMIKILGQLKFYVKNTNTIEKMTKVNHLVFDKTGTISISNRMKIKFKGHKLKKQEKFFIFLLVKNSNHPLSRNIAHYLYSSYYYSKIFRIQNFEEIPGKGIKGIINNQIYKIGSLNWILTKKNDFKNQTEVYISINNQVKGKFIFSSYYRDNLHAIINRLRSSYKISLISGDSNTEKEKLKKIFGNSSNLLFNQTPEDKMLYIKKLQKNGNNVLMIGDGLNDAGALKQSNVGISVSEDINSFLPASDAILDGKNFYLLFDFLELAKKSIYIIWISFIISFVYNIIGLAFAISGKLNPIIAAILMPISSITVILFTSVATWWISKKYF